MDGKNLCLQTNDVEGAEELRWYCWATCDGREETPDEDPLKCPSQFKMWPPMFCKKGEDGCVGPY